MAKKIETIQLQGKEYAQVKDRLMEFRNENGNGLIETIPTIQPDGQVLFKARILKDKSDENSAEATGHSYGTIKGAKAFEKLETIAVGRALALLGYGSDGEIASDDEMKEFEAYKEEKLQEQIALEQVRLEAVESLEELKTVWAELSPEAKEQLVAVKDELKAKYENS